MKKKKTGIDYLIYVLILLIIIVGIIMYINYRNEQIRINTYNIVLKGDATINIYEGMTYQEPGYYAYDFQNVDKANLVKVEGNVNSNVVGTYTLDYVINTKWKDNKITRTINVLENPFNYITFELKGDSVIQIPLGSTYTDQGYSLVSSRGENFENYVRTTGTVDTTKVGLFEIEYILTIGNKSKTLKRTIEVVGDHYVVSLDNSNPTNQNVTLTITSNLLNFDYFLIEDKKITLPNVTYLVTTNGNYVFEMYKKDGTKEDVTAEVTNIDKEAPTGTCSVTVNSKTNKSEFAVDVNDRNGISKIMYENLAYSEKIFTINKKLDGATIGVFDTVGNSATINCSLRYAFIEPTGGKVVKSFNSNTLKYKILQNGNYYETHIWAADPYNQMRSGLKFPFPQLAQVKDIVTYVSKRLNFKDKHMIAFNASGFVSNQFSTQFIGANPKWKNSSQTAVVIHEGKILRDFTKQTFPTKKTYTYGLKKDGYMAYYDISNGDKSHMASNQQKVKQMVSDGIKYTYGFSPLLVINGKKVTKDNSPNIRQGLCQIDKNNFVFLTNVSNNRGIGLSFSKMADIFLSLKCIYAVNLDGG